MSDVPGAWALLIVARALRGGPPVGGSELRSGSDLHVRKGWFGRALCRWGIHAWSLATPRYFVCRRCGKSKGM